MKEGPFIRLGVRQGWGGVESPFGVPLDSLARHMYVVGKSGTGKTSLLQRVFLDLALQGIGVAILDPHGDLAENLLRFLPGNLASKVTYFDPGDESFPVAWNLLANVPPYGRPLVASGIVSAFKHVWGDSWGPRLEHILYNSLRALLDAEQASLLGLPKLLSDAAYRKWVIRQIKDPFVKAFWTDEFEQYDQRFRQEAIAPIQNKIGPLVGNPILRNIVGQVRRKLDISAVIEEGRIFIANLSKGRIGEDPSNLIGSFLVSAFQQATMERAKVAETDRPPFVLIIDEFQNFGTSAFASILSEARKYGLCLILSHQFTSQLEPTIRDAVFGNAGTILSFQVGSTDADTMAAEFGGAFAPAHFVDLPPHHLLVKSSAVSGEVQPFRARTELHSHPDQGARHGIIRASRERHAAPRHAVEDKIRRWMKRWGEKT